MIDQRQAVHVLQVVIALVRLQRLVRLGGVALDERHADRVRPGLHLHACVFSRSSILSAVSDMFVSDAQVVLVAADLREEHALAVDRDLELVRELQAGHVADDVAQQEDVEFVVGVLREVVAEQQAAARAERQSLDVILLRVVGRHAVRLSRTTSRVGADGQAADLARRREVLLEQRRRDAQHARDVVEAVALVVGRQQLGDVDVEIEQVADRVAVFGAVQAMDRLVAGSG